MNYESDFSNGQYDFIVHTRKNGAAPVHLHQYFEIAYCKSGSDVIIVNGNPVTLKENRFLWIGSHCIHQYDCKNSTIMYVIFSGDMIPMYATILKGKQLVPKAIDAGELKDIFDILETISRDDIIKISGYLNLILAKVIECSDKEDANASDGVLYQKVMSYITQNFTENISLKKIAKKFGYSEKYLSHTLHDLTGVHFSNLLALHRINYAKELLIKNPKMKTVEVAYESGFSALNTFERNFKRITGLLPTQYRNKLNN